MRILLGVVLWRPSYEIILRTLVEANPTLKVDLALTNDTGSNLTIGEDISSHFGKITIFNGLEDLFLQCPDMPEAEIEDLFASFKTVSFWQNLLLLYSKARRYDVLLLWEDDQFPLCNNPTDFFSAQIEALQADPGLHASVSKRVGYLHRVPASINQSFSRRSLELLERAFCLCNEIVYPGLFVSHGGAFVFPNEDSPYGGIEHFEGFPFIYAGSLAINARADCSCFYTVPDLPNQSYSRGNDVFFSLGHKPFAVHEVAQSYLHDPWLSLLEGETSASCRTLQLEGGGRQEFLDLIMGWLSYAPLLLRLTVPTEWECRLKRVRQLLERAEVPGLCEALDAFSAKTHQDHEHFQETRTRWKQVCAALASGIRA